MNPSADISPSTLLLLDEIRKLFAERDAKWDQRFAGLDAAQDQQLVPRSGTGGAGEQRDAAVEPSIGTLEQHGAPTSLDPVVADITSTRLDAPRIVVQEVHEEQHADRNQDSGERKPTTLHAFTEEPDPGAVVDEATVDAAGSPHRLVAALGDIVDRLSLLPDVILRNIVSRLPLKDAARTALLSRRWKPLRRAAPSVSLAPIKARPFFVYARAEQERRTVITRTKGPGAIGRVLVSTDITRLHCVHLGPEKSVSRVTWLSSCDSCLDDDPATNFIHFDAPLHRAIGRIDQALAAAAALRADAVGAAGGGLLAWVVAAESAQATCSTFCLAGNRNLADIVVGNDDCDVLRPDEMVTTLVILKHARLEFVEMPSTYTTTIHSEFYAALWCFQHL